MARSRIEIAGDALEHQSDADLAVRASAGDREAFEELYRRHSRTAMRVAYRVTGNIHDAGDAVGDAFARVMQALPQGRLAEPTRFRSYLLTATRHAAVDVLRRAGRAIPSENGGEPAQTTAGPSELLIDRADNALVATAFRALPERWRSVLWLTEVEGIPAREAATMLGVSPNGVAQLAVRARAGLRERYLQAHLTDVEGDCRETVRRLGAYVGGALSPRDIARVDQHLASCAACCTRREELEQIGTTLRKAAIPVPVFAGGGLLTKLWGAVNSLFQTGADTAVSRIAPVGAAAAAVFVASIAGVGVVKDRQADAVQPPTAVAAAPITSKPIARTADAAAEAPVAAPQTSGAGATAPTDAAKPARQHAGFTPRTQAAAPIASTTTTTTAPSTTPTTTPPPASHNDDKPPVALPDLPDLPDVPDVPVVDEPDVEVPELPDVPELPEVPGLPELPAIGDVTGALPLELVALQALTGAAEFSELAWWLPADLIDVAEFDAPLPSPEAPGLPV